MTDGSHLTDEELMLLYQKGQVDAFNTLYARHSGKVYGYIRQKIRNAAEAGDVFQSVFAKVHSSRHRYSPDYPFLPWLFTVTRSVLIDAVRKKGRDSAFIEVGNELVEQATAAQAVGAPYASSAAEASNAIAGLESLPEQQRQAIELRYRDDQSFEEIASVLKTSPSNVRQLISRGIRNLRRVAGLKETP